MGVQAIQTKIKVTFEIVDAARAVEFLSLNHYGNRSVSKRYVGRYAREMENGTWIEDTEIKIDETGMLLDGQHRLRAVIESNTKQRFMVTRGWPQKTIQTLDAGRCRSFAVQSKMLGETIGERHAAAARFCLLLDMGGFTNSYMPSRSEIKNWIARLEPQLSHCLNKIKGRPSMSAAAYVAVILASKIHPGPVDEFITQVMGGELLTKEDPAHQFREYLFATKQKNNSTHNNLERFVKTASAIAAHIAGQRRQLIRKNYGFARDLLVRSNIKTDLIDSMKEQFRA